MRRLTNPEKVLIHLHRFSGIGEEYSAEQTQEGISRGTGIQRTHVPRSIKVLRERKLVEERKAHVQGFNRQLKTYSLTHVGYEEAKRLVEDMKKESLRVKIRGKTEEMTVSSVLDLDLVSMEDIIKSRGVLDVDSLRRVFMPFTSLPDISEFYNRNIELQEIAAFLEGDANVLVIYGGIGAGASTLAYRAADMQKENWNIAWLTLKGHNNEEKENVIAGAEEVDAALKRFGEEIGAKYENLGSFHGFRTLVVIDDWYDVPDSLVEYFAANLDSIKRSDVKLIITSLENTPSYSRFYRMDHIKDGTVEELHIRGLEPEYCRQILGDIGDEALRKIFMMTHGRPLYLKLLEKGDVDALLSVSSFTREEIRYLMFLADSSGH